MEIVRRLPAAALRGQILLIAVVVVLHMSIAWAPKGTFHPLLVRLVDVDYEMNLPTWFSSAQWFLMSLTLGSIAVVVGAAERSRIRRVLWACSAALALFLSIDEVAMIHERAGTVLEEVITRAPQDSSLRAVLGLHSYYWIVAYLPLVVPAIIVGTVFLWKELGKSRVAAFSGIFTLLYAAVGLDFIEGRFGVPDHSGVPLRIASHTFMLDIALVEESLEMIGVCLIQFALLRHLASVTSWAIAQPTEKALDELLPVVTSPKTSQSDRNEAFESPALVRRASSL